MNELEFHPLADIFPLIEGEEFSALCEDIRQNGVMEAIVLLDDKILDGRNRYRAARAVGVDCPELVYDGPDPVGFVISLNLRRRHLNESQRAMIAAKLANMPAHRPANKSANLPTSQPEAAALLNVSDRSVRSAAVVRDNAVPELSGKVESGAVSVSAAADVARLPAAEQREIVARGEKEILEAAKAIRADRAGTRRAERIEKLVEISKGNAALGTAQRFPVIYGDPPWRYEHAISDSRVIENHYPTMSLEEICALPMAKLATDDAVLFLWATAPKLGECFEVLKAWGFEYRTCAVWAKDKIGMGYYVRNQHELLLIAKRGEPPTPQESNRPSSLIHAAREAHSAKPVEFYELIEGMYPELPKIELFCRSPREGWAAWGNQAEVA
jgi:N6-adenosine-specific RNA methylase IME4/ParB-like chromosome segregation protein Spo0J